jgi:hypothetical protein
MQQFSESLLSCLNGKVSHTCKVFWQGYLYMHSCTQTILANPISAQVCPYLTRLARMHCETTLTLTSKIWVFKQYY